jgi:hypothetical protein
VVDVVLLLQVPHAGSEPAAAGVVARLAACCLLLVLDL